MIEITKKKLTKNFPGIRLKDACVVLVRTSWNSSIVNLLEDGCRKTLVAAGVKEIICVTVPGAIEIPFAVKYYWEHCSKKNKPDCFVALGCVIRGGTPHFEYVSSSVSDGVLKLNLQLPVPVIFGVLTVDNPEQASERLGGIHGHKGEEAGDTAVQMIQFTRKFK